MVSCKDCKHFDDKRDELVAGTGWCKANKEYVYADNEICISYDKLKGKSEEE